MQMSKDDYHLSMRISRRPRHETAGDESLRSLIVHRLSDTTKAVFRRSLRRGNVSEYCESCDSWDKRHDEGLPEEWRCRDCDRLFRLEFAVYEEILEEGEE
jgi:hypothetical protein